MAVSTLALFTLAQEYRGDVVRQINRRTATLKMLRIVPGEGKNIAWVPEFDGAMAETYAEGADVSSYGQDGQKSAILTWALYRSNVQVTKLAMDAAASSHSPEGNLQLWARHLVNGSAKLAAHINSEIFAGPGTGTRMAGLGVAVDSAGVYATVDPAVDTSWASYEATGAPTALTFALIRDDLRAIYEACGETPDMGACSPDVFNKIGALFDNTRRQVDSVRGGNGMVKLEFGFQALEVDGTVFFRDKDCTAATIYYLNTDGVEIQYLPSANQRLLEAAAGGSIQPDDGFGSVPLGFEYEMLAKTGPAEKAEILWTGQLVVTRRNAHGKRTAIA